MKYPIAIEPGDDSHAFGVVVPDPIFQVVFLPVNRRCSPEPLDKKRVSKF
jgi:hypothetical protein